MLTRNQFNVLECMVNSNNKLSQRNIANCLDMSVGTINKILAELFDLGYVDNNEVTKAGYDALEPFRVKRAVLLSAGLGARLIPITLNTPKPMVAVKGKRLIETVLDALVEKDITEIYIVRGYLASQFDELLEKYPTIKFIENKEYNEANNILSVALARDYLAGSYILETDWFLYNKDIIRKYQYSSNYMGIPVESTNDWCLYTTSNKIITKVAIGGENCYRMVGFSYWTEEDGKKLAKDVIEVINSPGGRERYWDQVPLEFCKDNYKLSLRPCKEEDLIEIDTFNELKALDPSYDI